MKTKRAQELLKHFKNNGISQEPGNGLNLVLEYQDIIGHSTRAEVADFESDLDQDGRKNFVWVNFLTLAQDSAIDILKDTVLSRFVEREAAAMDETWNKKWKEHHEASTQLDESKKAIYKKINKLEAENARLRSKLKFSDTMKESAWSNNQDLLRSVSMYKDKAQKFDNMKALLS